MIDLEIETGVVISVVAEVVLGVVAGMVGDMITEIEDQIQEIVSSLEGHTHDQDPDLQDLPAHEVPTHEVQTRTLEAPPDPGHEARNHQADQEVEAEKFMTNIRSDQKTDQLLVRVDLLALVSMLQQRRRLHWQEQQPN